MIEELYHWNRTIKVQSERMIVKETQEEKNDSRAPQSIREE